MRKLLSGAGVLVLLMASCQKEVDWTLTNRVASDSTYLAKIIELDTSFATGLDTAFIYRYTYDAQKRLYKVYSTFFNSGTHDIYSNNLETRFYSGNDTVPYKITSSEDLVAGPDTNDTTFLNYQNGVIVFDSMRYYQSGILTNIHSVKYLANGPGRFIVNRTSYDPSSGTVSYSDVVSSTRTYSGLNTIASTDSISSPFTGGLNEYLIYTYSFDNKINPFRSIALPYPLYIDLTNNISFQYIPNPASYNNPVSYTLVHWFTGSTNTFAVQFVYTYNSNNYPVIIKNAVGPGTDPVKDLLFYTAL